MEKETYNYSLEFKDFILSLQKWIDEGCPEGQPYVKTDSLCFQRVHYPGLTWETRDKLANDLNYALEEDFNDTQYPFNDSDRDWNNEESDPASGHYANPRRLSWIEKMADKFTEEGK